MKAPLYFQLVYWSMQQEWGTTRAALDWQCRCRWKKSMLLAFLQHRLRGKMKFDSRKRGNPKNVFEEKMLWEIFSLLRGMWTNEDLLRTQFKYYQEKKTEMAKAFWETCTKSDSLDSYAMQCRYRKDSNDKLETGMTNCFNSTILKNST